MPTSTLVRPREFTSAKEIMANVRATNEWRKRLGEKPPQEMEDKPIEPAKFEMPMTFPSLSCTITIGFQSIFKDRAISNRENKFPPDFVCRIKKMVAIEFDSTVTDIVSGRRDKASVIPRHVAIYLTKVLTTKSLPEIGRLFGNRDHTSCLFAIRKMPIRMGLDDLLSEKVILIKNRLHTELEKWRAGLI